MGVPFQTTNRGGRDAFVSKVSAAGSTLVYSTYLGGTMEEETTGIAVDASGQAVVAGTTYSADFPTAAPYQGSLRGTGDGSGATLTTYTVALQPGEYKQERAFFVRGHTNLTRAYARVTVTTGSGVIALASVVDNLTNDPTTIPMLR